MAGWSNGKTLLWIAAADAQGKKHKYRKGDIGFHHYAFELSSRKDVDALGVFLEANGMNVVDPPGEYYGRNYYAVYFTDPDGMKLEGMIWAPPEKKPVKKLAKKEAPAARRKRLERRRVNPDCRVVRTPHATAGGRARPRYCGRGVWRHRARCRPPQ